MAEIAQAISELKAKRGRIKGSLTRLKTFADDIPHERKTIEEMEVRLENLARLYEEFVKIDDKLVSLAIPSDFEEVEEKVLEIKPLLLKTLKMIRANEPQTIVQNREESDNALSRLLEQQRDFMSQFGTQVPIESSTSSFEVRLPKIQIEAFGGDYKDWPSFKDLFVASVDRREGLSNVHKLQYLKSFLKDDAAALIKHIPVTEANYAEAWAKLLARYDKKRHILNSYINTFINQSQVTQSSSTMLRRLTDISDEVVRGIAALGDNATGRDPWLIYLIINKTDQDTRQAWAEEITNQDLPSLQDLFCFLNQRCDALETVDPVYRKAHGAKKAPIRNFHSEVAITCSICSQQHHLYKCPKFKDMDVAERRRFVANHSLCFNCLSTGHHAQKCSSKFVCHYCKQTHHSSLHFKNVTNNNHTDSHHSSNNFTDEQPFISTSNNLIRKTHAFTSPQLQESTSPARRNSDIHTLTTFNSQPTRVSLLPTALVQVMDSTGTLQSCRLLIDSGSQASFVSEECVQRLRLPRRNNKIAVRGLSSVSTGYTRGSVTLTIASRYDSSQQFSVNAFILTKVMSPQPATEFKIEDWNYLKGYPLADPRFNQPNKIDILLGVEHFIQILKQGQNIPSSQFPPLQNTIFGYIVAGTLVKASEIEGVDSLYTDVENIDATLCKFWEIEEIMKEEPPYSLEEQYCEAHFVKSHYVDQESGRYTVRLPIKEELPTLGDTLTIAMRRFKSLEKRFQHNPTLYKEYKKFITEYKDMGHLEPVPSNVLNSKAEHAYLPHHAVVKPSSTTTKLRVVFDGSAATSTGMSLNQKLLVGPKTQRDLFPILLSFRTFHVAVSADIEKMYRMILVDKQDRNYQRIIWRDNDKQQFQHFWLNTVTYGTSSAPFLATRSLKQVAIDFHGQSPLASQTINNNFYVDDLMSGAETVEEALQIHEELSTLLKLRGFQLRKWTSNSQEFLKSLPPENCSLKSYKIDENVDVVKILGIKWIPAEDYFTFEVNLPAETSITKRTILSESSRLFDPLGLLAPITVTFKIILQRLWLQNLAWDDTITGDLAKKWREIRSCLDYIQGLRIPRWLATNGDNFEIHGFSDASEMAFAAAVYCRSTSQTGEIAVNLVASKTRVAPIKQVSVPRLELCGALLATQLIQSVKNSFGKPNLKCFAWTDSKVVLAWLSSNPRKWKCFVGNRTSEILSRLPRSCWNYVPSKENPADIASRGVLPQNLVNSELWWRGPPWLQDDWSKKIAAEQTPDLETANLEKRDRYIDAYATNITNDSLSHLFERKSSLRMIIRILSRCMRFYRNCSGRSSMMSTPWFTADELNHSWKICIRWTQANSFNDELKCLKKQQPVPISSRLRSLTPFIDDDKPTSRGAIGKFSMFL